MTPRRPVACEVPAASAIGRPTVEAAFFCDAYRAPLSRAGADVVDLFFAVFGHHPAWLKQTLIWRNRWASACGLKVASDADILQPRRHAQYRVGDTIGPWPVFGLSDAELIAGRDNTHLDFRLSVLREDGGPQPAVVISTVCTAHGRFGRAYLRLVIPFHRWGVMWLISRALAAGRL